MRFCVVFYALWISGVSACEVEFRKVCYFASWATYRPGDAEFNVTNIDLNLCTHYIYAFVGITENGEVEILDPWTDLPDDGGAGELSNFVALRKVNPKAKFMVSIGGWSQGSVTFSRVVGDVKLRSNFIESVVNFTIEYRFDGFDFDWEYPARRGGSEADVENFVILLRELRPLFDENNLIMSAAVAAGEESARVCYDISGISKYLDFISLMTYEYHLPSDGVAAANAPLYSAKRETSSIDRTLNIDASVRYWLDKGAPAKKLNLGIALYGKSYTLTDPAEHNPGSPIKGPGRAGEYTREPGVLAYYEIRERLLEDGWNSAWDDEQLVPYAYKGDQWVSYDNRRSIERKINYVKELCLGGVMTWCIDEDDFRGKFGEKNPLLNTINNELR